MGDYYGYLYYYKEKIIILISKIPILKYMMKTILAYLSSSIMNSKWHSARLNVPGTLSLTLFDWRKKD